MPGVEATGWREYSLRLIICRYLIAIEDNRYVSIPPLRLHRLLCYVFVHIVQAALLKGLKGTLETLR